MDFVVIDVETANPDSSSICQVGIASFCAGKLVDSWVTLVNPEDDFNSFNVAIHGIDEDQVRNAPTWVEVFPEVHARLRDSVVVSHTTFDRIALRKACDRSHMESCEYTWLDSTRVVRMTWPQFSKAGYGLTNLARHFGIVYQAHDALEDARCAGLLVLRAMAETGLSTRQWLARAAQPIAPAGPTSRPSRSYPEQVRREGNPEGELFGEVLVFTGSLSISRPEAADAAAAAGCSVESGVNRHTTLLVVGGRTLQRRANPQKSAKHLMAEKFMARGQAIRILGESDFLRLVARAGTQQVSE